MTQQTDKKNSFLLAFLIIAAISFMAGRTSSKNSQSTVAGEQGDISAMEFSTEKSKKPEFKFYVMSFCPYGNQIETTLKPVFELLKDQVDWKPQYIFSKVDDTNAFCDQRVYNEEKCLSYIEQGYFTNLTECKTNFVETVEECKNKYLLESSETAYSSLHGRGELNQNVREICAYSQAEDKTDWWNFISLTNQNCNQDNVDSCWEQQAKDSNLDTKKIKDCFTKDATSLIDQHLADSEADQAFSSPTLLINGVSFPPENAYQQDGSGKISINKKVFTQDQFRSPEVLKQAVCASFKKQPKECKTELETKATVNQGGC